jgi:acyl-homoserine-lactone acylase
VKDKYGALDVAWGDVHRLQRGNLDVPTGGFISEYRRGFRGGPYGDYGSFRVIDYQQAQDGKWVAVRGDSYILAVEFTSPPTAYSICAYSQSGDPQSPHHTDQSVLFAREEFKRAYLTEEDVAKHLGRSYHPGFAPRRLTARSRPDIFLRKRLPVRALPWLHNPGDFAQSST